MHAQCSPHDASCFERSREPLPISSECHCALSAQLGHADSKLGQLAVCMLSAAGFLQTLVASSALQHHTAATCLRYSSLSLPPMASSIFVPRQTFWGKQPCNHSLTMLAHLCAASERACLRYSSLSLPPMASTISGQIFIGGGKALGSLPAARSGLRWRDSQRTPETELHRDDSAHARIISRLPLPAEPQQAAGPAETVTNACS